MSDLSLTVGTLDWWVTAIGNDSTSEEIESRCWAKYCGRRVLSDPTPHMRLLVPGLGCDLGDSVTLAQLGKRVGVGLEILRSVLPADGVAGLTDSEIESALADTLYAGYIKTQRLTLQRVHQHDGLRIRTDFSFRGLSGLSHEMVERFERARPLTFGEARRIPGLTPAAVSMLLVHLTVQHQASR